MDYDSEHKVDDSDNGWVLHSKEIGEDSKIVPESDGNNTMLTVKM